MLWLSKTATSEKTKNKIITNGLGLLGWCVLDVQQRKQILLICVQLVHYFMAAWVCWDVVLALCLHMGKERQEKKYIVCSITKITNKICFFKFFSAACHMWVWGVNGCFYNGCWVLYHVNETLLFKIYHKQDSKF